MIAPLYDNRGTVRYFIGCQIDVSALIEGGRGLESFERLLQQDRTDSRYGEFETKSPPRALAELSQLLSSEESEIVRNNAAPPTPGRATPVRAVGGRKYLGMDDPMERNMWPNPQYGPSGRLPGVYQNVSTRLLEHEIRLA